MALTCDRCGAKEFPPHRMHYGTETRREVKEFTLSTTIHPELHGLGNRPESMDMARFHLCLECSPLLLKLIADMLRGNPSAADRESSV